MLRQRVEGFIVKLDQAIVAVFFVARPRIARQFFLKAVVAGGQFVFHLATASIWRCMVGRDGQHD